MRLQPPPVSSSIKSAFRQGATDTFKVKANNVGHIHKIYIEHDNSGKEPGCMCSSSSILFSLTSSNSVAK